MNPCGLVLNCHGANDLVKQRGAWAMLKSALKAVGTALPVGGHALTAAVSK